MSQQMLQGLFILILCEDARCLLSLNRKLRWSQRNISLTKAYDNKYNMNNQQNTKEQPINESERIIINTEYSVQIQYTTSQIKELKDSQPNNQEQSFILPRQALHYNIEQNTVLPIQQQPQQHSLHPLTPADPIDTQIEVAEPAELQRYRESQENNNFSTTPDHFTVSRVFKVNDAQQQYQSVRSDNFPVKEIYYQPVQVELPAIKAKNQTGEEKLMNETQEVLVPCTFVQTAINKAPEPQLFTSKVEDRKSLNASKVDEQEKTKIITDVLLEKINQLENKVKSLEQEKKKNEELIKSAEYQSTPPTPGYGSIKKNNQIIKRFSTVNQTQQTSNQSNNQFRVRSVTSKTIANPDYKIHSNIYSLTLVEAKNDNSNIKDELELLKRKLHALENSHKFGDPSIKNNIKEHNFKIFQNKPEEKLCTPNRTELRGKIVKRSGSKLHSPENTFRTQTEESIEMDADKGFIRSGPPKMNGHESKMIGDSMYSNINQPEQPEMRKRTDSSAIFRKNPGPAIIKKRTFDLDNFAKSNTLQFYPDRQKLIIDSRESESMLPKSETFSPILTNYSEIHLPDLKPSPNPETSSDQLIEIGKLTFKKLGCEITQNTVLSVKKFKNCVLFSLGNDNNILWHYEGRFYFGGWKTHANGEGEKHGKGIEFVPGKYKYRGYFEDGKRCGFGTMIGENGSVYVGQWYDGLKQGKGKYLQSDGTEYEGDWKSGKKSGTGKLYFKGKLQFEGNFVSGLKTGFGKEYFQNGDYYEGEYLQNKFDGQGSYLWASKALYNGQFKDGKRHGQGIWRSGQKNYDAYEGEYAEDNKNGYGVYKWANGAVYKGTFKNDLKHGEGTITYENGKTVHMVWNKGNVEKTLSSSQFFEQSSRGHHQNSSTINQTSAPKHKIKKSITNTRSTQNLQSAKSLKSERSLPKGVSIKKDTQLQSSPKSSPKVQFRGKFNNTELLRAKMSVENRQTGPTGTIKDPPYRGMQTSSNINMNV